MVSGYGVTEVCHQPGASMGVLSTLSAAPYKTVPVRVVGWFSGAQCAFHGDGLVMSEDDSIPPVQGPSTLLAEALWPRLDLRGVSLHVQCLLVHQFKTSTRLSRSDSYCLLCVRCVCHAMEATSSTFSKHYMLRVYIPIYRTTSRVPTG